MSVTGPTVRPVRPPTSINRETFMAATRKSAKRTRGKKRSAKAATSKKRRKSTKKAGSSKKKSSRGRSARGPLTRVRAAGKKTWKALKSTTAHVVEGVKGTFGTEDSSDGR